MHNNYDIAIIGGGPVGTSLALALRGSQYRVHLIESRTQGAVVRDARALALSYGSRLLIERLGAWAGLADISPIESIHVSQANSFGSTVIRAEDVRLPQLGYVIPYSELQRSLSVAMDHAETEKSWGASVTSIRHEQTHVTIEYVQDGLNKQMCARLAVVADGGKLLEERYPNKTHDYGQSALLTHVTCSRVVPARAFERFTPHGPLALLPFRDGYELVWTSPHELAKQMMNWDEARFLKELQVVFGNRVGNFLSVSKRSVFPLYLRKAPQQAPMAQTILLGNAAQTLHPVAGQGFNLGLRDAWELAQVIYDCREESLGSEAMLNAYKKRRRVDRDAGIFFTDKLVRLFSNDFPVLSGLRSAALTALDCSPIAKNFIARRMMFGTNG
jgi:2-octaprenyl-6-methoxyphenol hydroxylase